MRGLRDGKVKDSFWVKRKRVEDSRFNDCCDVWILTLLEGLKIENDRVWLPY